MIPDETIRGEGASDKDCAGRSGPLGQMEPTGFTNPRVSNLMMRLAFGSRIPHSDELSLPNGIEPPCPRAPTRYSSDRIDGFAPVFRPILGARAFHP
jgi:hypothetical protein